MSVTRNFPLDRSIKCNVPTASLEFRNGEVGAFTAALRPSHLLCPCDALGLCAAGIGRVPPDPRRLRALSPTLACDDEDGATYELNPDEVASKLAVETISGFVRRIDEEGELSWPYGIEPNLSFAGNLLRTAVHLANRRVFRAAERDDDYTGMATTVVAALISGSRLTVASAGDSRSAGSQACFQIASFTRSSV